MAKELPPHARAKRKWRTVYTWLLLWAAVPPPLAAYLDPGTGSMLVSALVGLVSTVYFTVRSSAFTWRVRLSGLLARTFGKRRERRTGSADKPHDSAITERRHSIVFFSEGRQYWNCFEPILQELQSRQLPAAYWTMDPRDPALTAATRQSLGHIESRFIGTSYAAFAQMNTLKADVCVMTAPGLDVLQVRRSKRVGHYSHIIHALDDCTLYRTYGTDYFDSVLLSGAHQVEALEALEAARGLAPKQKYIVGCTYLDALAQKLATLQQQSAQSSQCSQHSAGEAAEAERVLVAPSWGPNGLLAKYGMRLFTPLLQAGYGLIVRPHPQSRLSEPDLLVYLQAALAPYSSSGQVQWDFQQDNIHSFMASAAMISDFSSVMYDYCILQNKPVFVAEFAFNYDGYDAMDLLPREPWSIAAGRAIGITFNEAQLDRLPQQLHQALEAGSTGAPHGNLAQIRSVAYCHPGEGGRRAAECIVQIRDAVAARPKNVSFM